MTSAGATDLETLPEIEFDNRFVASLPADPSDAVGSRQVSGAAYSLVEPASVSKPQIIAWSDSLAEELGLGGIDPSSTEAAKVFTGQSILAGSEPHAMAYGGHQFGHWAGQLGDGRAIALGEIQTPEGSHQTLQLKGAGPTPFSRRADGLAVLRSSVREFLMSEAMHHLGVPTSRALSLAVTGDNVMRDKFYDGNPAPEPGAIVCRTAPSFLRFGNFELFASRGETELLKRLVDFSVEHFATAEVSDQEPSAERYGMWFNEICTLTAELVVDWLRVGFVHGVLNTDNMSIHGITIDYGPYGWLNEFDPDWTPNTTDAGQKRYRFGAQAAVAQWNLIQLANALLPVVEDQEILRDGLDAYADSFIQKHQQMMLTKLGLIESQQLIPNPDLGSVDDSLSDTRLVEDLLTMLSAEQTDMTIFYRRLADVTETSQDPAAIIHESYYDPSSQDEAFRLLRTTWFERYQRRLQLQVSQHPNEKRQKQMNSANPLYVLRNHLAHEAILAAEAGNYEEIDNLSRVLKSPYEQQQAGERYAAKQPTWARDTPGCSQLSCSS